MLDTCKDLFDKYPLLEMVMGPVNKTVLMGKQKTKWYYLKAFWLFPLWFSMKIMQKKKQVACLPQSKQSIQMINNELPTGIFRIEDVRSNNYGCIYPVLKKFDRLHHQSILFTRAAVFTKKNIELNSLENTQIILDVHILANLGIGDVFSCFFSAFAYYQRLIMYTKEKTVLNFERNYKYFILFKLAELLLNKKSISQYLEDINPRFIFSWGSYKPLLAVGNDVGIPKIMIQHGTFTNVKNPAGESFFYKESPPPELSPHYSDEIIVWGESSQKFIQKLYKYGDKVIVLGNPRFDDIIEKYVGKEKSPLFYQKFGLDENKPTFVFFSGTHAIDDGQSAERNINPIIALDAIVEKLSSKVNVVVKLHPHENQKYYEQYMKHLDKITMMKNEVMIYELLQHTDIAASVESTTLLEAMIFKIPTLQLSLSKHGVRSDFYKNGAAVLIQSQQQLFDIIIEIVNNTYDFKYLSIKQQEYLEKNVANLGKATECIVNHLVKKI